MIKEKLNAIIIMLAVLSFTIILPEKLIGRNLFYLYSAVILVCFLAKIKQVRFQLEELILSLSIFLMGLSQSIWVWRFPGISSELYRADFNYPKTGMYLIIGSVIILCFSSLLRITSINYRKIIPYALLFSFTGLTLYAVYCKLASPENRIELNTSSTLSAALYTLHSLLTIYSLLCTKIKNKNIIILCVILFSTYILILTGTRSALIIYPLVLVYFAFSQSALSKKQSLIIVSIVFAMFFMVIKFSHTELNKRGMDLINEISTYHENNNTSVGSRLSMWNAGVHEIISYPTGVSAQERFLILSDFINENERGNPEAIRNIAYHLHNDLIETMSLQGVIGGIVLLFFYISLISYFYKKKTSYCAAVFLCAPVIFMGSTDTLFIHVRFVIMLIDWLIIFNGLNESGLKKRVISSD